MSLAGQWDAVNGEVLRCATVARKGLSRDHCCRGRSLDRVSARQHVTLKSVSIST